MDNNFNEYDAMRKDMALLKNKLESQEIINEELIHKTVKTSLKGMSRDQLIWIVIAILGIPYCCWVFRSAGLSWAFCIATVVFLATCAIIMFCNRVRLANMMSTSDKDLLSCAKELKEMKKSSVTKLKYSMAVVFLWLVWLFLELYMAAKAGGRFDMDYYIGFGVGALVGGLIGGLLGARYFIKNQKELQKNIDSIEEYRNQK